MADELLISKVAMIERHGRRVREEYAGAPTTFTSDLLTQGTVRLPSYAGHVPLFPYRNTPSLKRPKSIDDRAYAGAGKPLEY